MESEWNKESIFFLVIKINKEITFATFNFCYAKIILTKKNTCFAKMIFRLKLNPKDYGFCTKGRLQWFFYIYKLDNLILSIHKGTRKFLQLNLIVPLFNKVLMYFWLIFFFVRWYRKLSLGHANLMLWLDDVAIIWLRVALKTLDKIMFHRFSGQILKWWYYRFWNTHFSLTHAFLVQLTS